MIHRKRLTLTLTLTLAALLAIWLPTLAQAQQKIEIKIDGKTVVDGTYTPKAAATQPTKPSVPPPVVASDTSPLVLDKPIELADGQTLDGKGATIDARGVDVAFRVYDRANVTIKNYKVRADGDSHVIDVWQSKNVTISNIEVIEDANYVVRIRRSGKVAVDGVTAASIRAYLFWIDGSDGVTIRNSKLTVGSRHETALRAQYGWTNLLIENCTFTNTINKKTALRLHDGKNGVVKSSAINGLAWFGPMGGGDGGQDEPDKAKRVAELAYTTEGVVIDGCTINGSIGPQAGLTGFVMRNSTINVPDDAPYYGYAFNNVVWFYPDKPKQRLGEPVRGQPRGQLVDVKVFAKQKTLNWTNNQGPLDRVRVTLNGKPAN